MTISRSSWEKYIMTLRDINNAAAEKLVKYLNTHNVLGVGTTTEMVFDDASLKEFIDYAFAIVNEYGEAAGALAAEMYDLTAEFEGVILPPAELAPLANYGDVAKAIQGTMKVSQNVDEIASAAARWVKMAAADTTLHNAKRDRAQFAWIPSGETCSFCIMLASNGWQNISRAALKGGHAEHIHSNCDCQYTVRHTESFNIAGYDPTEYRNMYYGVDDELKAEGVPITPRSRLNAMRRNAYAENKPTEGINNDGLIDVN